MAILTLQFADIWYTSYASAIVLPFYRRGNWVVILIYMVLLFLFFKGYGAFRIGYLRRTDMMFSQILSILGTNAVTYLQISLIARAFVSAFPMLLLTGIELVLVLCWTFLTERLFFRLYPPRRLAVVYSKPEASALVMKMSSRVDKYMICESIHADCGLDAIIRETEHYDGLILCEVSPELRNALVSHCFEKKLRAYVVPEISDIILRGAEDIRLFDTPLLLCRNYGLTFEQRCAKRLFDIAFSLVMLVLTSPVMLLCAAAVKLCDGGPVIYQQERLTRNGRRFCIYKFRSMIPDAEADGEPQVARDGDERVTSVGRIMRKCRLDELPQLFNILKGEMSVVGPRPERPELCEEYEKQFPEFRFRLSVKAGLTGYAQVTGVYDTTPCDKLKMDLMYIEKYSLLRDIQILLMTLKIILFPVQKSNAQLLGTQRTDKNKKGDAV